MPFYLSTREYKGNTSGICDPGLMTQGNRGGKCTGSRIVEHTGKEMHG